MAEETRRFGLGGTQLDITQILLEAQNRWLRPAEICEIIRNYKKSRIAPEPPHMPPSGSLFLFDRKVLRHFRKDGHDWRKTKDGKTIKDAHERLRAGCIDVLHCYYAYGEKNKNFQRRSYWMLEEDLSHIVLVHYLEVKASKVFPKNTDTTSLNSAQASEYKDVESVHDDQANSKFHSFVELQLPVMEKTDPASSVPDFPVPFSNDYERKNSGISSMEFISLAREHGKDTGHATLTYEPQEQFEWSSWEEERGSLGRR